MMNKDRAFVTARSVTDPAVIAIPLQDCFPQPSKILLILPLQCVASGAKPQGKDLRIPAGAVHRALDWLLHRFSVRGHFPALAMYRYKVGRLISKAAAIAVLDSPAATRLLSSFIYVAFRQCFRPT